MKVLVEIHKSPTKRFLIKIKEQRDIDYVNNLINKGDRLKAITAVLSRGTFIKDITERDLLYIHADLVISEDHTYFDLM